MDNRISEMLRLERLRRRITQYEMFAMTGIDPPRMSRFENNKIEPKPNELTVWKTALGFDPHAADDALLASYPLALSAVGEAPK